MDLGLFVSYELTAESLSTKLFRHFTLHSVPLHSVLDFRKAEEEDVTPLNRVNWLKRTRNRNFNPVYTLRANEKSPRVFMRLRQGSHFELSQIVEKKNASPLF